MKPFLYLAALLVLTGLSAAPAFGDIVYSDLGSGGSYETFGYAVSGSEAVGESFTPSANYKFTDAQLALSIGDLGGGTSADVYLESDSSGKPESILDALVEQSPITGAGSLITFDCASCPTLFAGTKYWIVAGKGNGLTGWNENDTGRY